MITINTVYSKKFSTAEERATAIYRETSSLLFGVLTRNVNVRFKIQVVKMAATSAGMRASTDDTPVSDNANTMLESTTKPRQPTTTKRKNSNFNVVATGAAEEDRDIAVAYVQVVPVPRCRGSARKRAKWPRASRGRSLGSRLEV